MEASSDQSSARDKGLKGVAALLSFLGAAAGGLLGGYWGMTGAVRAAEINAEVAELLVDKSDWRAAVEAIVAADLARRREPPPSAPRPDDADDGNDWWQFDQGFDPVRAALLTAVVSAPTPSHRSALADARLVAICFQRWDRERAPIVDQGQLEEWWPRCWRGPNESEFEAEVKRAFKDRRAVDVMAGELWKKCVFRILDPDFEWAG